jgi:hypothetical protein
MATILQMYSTLLIENIPQISSEQINQPNLE